MPHSVYEMDELYKREQLPYYTNINIAYIVNL
jgi:hypothetical protein